MKQLSEQIMEKKVEINHVSIFFMGQAGLIIKTAKGTLVAIDLYLSDCVQRYDGFKRLMPKLLAPDEITFDAVIATHAHYDHFDIDAMPVLMKEGKTILISALDGKKECDKLGIDPGRVRYVVAGDTYQISDVMIRAVRCDHGPDTPYAVGLSICVNDKLIYITGDTALHPEYARDLQKQPDIMFAPINGAFGNLNEHEAVELCKAIEPKLIVPYHYWNFAEHGGNPYLFVQELTNKLPSQKYLLMCMGESVDI